MNPFASWSTVSWESSGRASNFLTWYDDKYQVAPDWPPAGRVAGRQHVDLSHPPQREVVGRCAAHRPATSPSPTL